ncbi:MAG TPA: twin-arginine translocase TatA/TatE family subunit [Ornithinicoccus sp.]|nr:twin-arginine translocase TatA/TatE family subunit [Ornithinicoccus sp.]
MRPSAWQIVALVIILILLFGWKSLPNMARSLGQSMRIFKSEVDQMKEPSAASRDTVRGETAHEDGDRDEAGQPRAEHMGDRGYGDPSRDPGEQDRSYDDRDRDRGAQVRDEFREGLRGEDGRGDDPRV